MHRDQLPRQGRPCGDETCSLLSQTLCPTPFLLPVLPPPLLFLALPNPSIVLLGAPVFKIDPIFNITECSLRSPRPGAPRPPRQTLCALRNAASHSSTGMYLRSKVSSAASSSSNGAVGPCSVLEKNPVSCEATPASLSLLHCLLLVGLFKIAHRSRRSGASHLPSPSFPVCHHSRLLHCPQRPTTHLSVLFFTFSAPNTVTSPTSIDTPRASQRHLQRFLL